MAVSSTMLALGTRLPAFSLPDVRTGSVVDSATFAGAPVLVTILCNHCPYVKHVQKELAALGSHCDRLGVKMVAVSSNDVAAYPEDGPAEMAREAAGAGYGFPYLYDETQAVAKAFRAACTPEAYLFDRAGLLVYRGRLDDSTPKNGRPVTGKDVRAAIDAVVSGDTPDPEQNASIGCSIKWKPGGEPDYL